MPDRNISEKSGEKEKVCIIFITLRFHISSQQQTSYLSPVSKFKALRTEILILNSLSSHPQGLAPSQNLPSPTFHPQQPSHLQQPRIINLTRRPPPLNRPQTPP